MKITSIIFFLLATMNLVQAMDNLELKTKIDIDQAAQERYKLFNRSNKDERIAWLQDLCSQTAINPEEVKRFSSKAAHEVLPSNDAGLFFKLRCAKYVCESSRAREADEKQLINNLAAKLYPSK